MKTNWSSTPQATNREQDSDSIATFLRRFMNTGAAPFTSVLSEFENRTLPAGSPLDAIMASGMIQNAGQPVNDTQKISWQNTPSLPATAVQSKESVASIKVGTQNADTPAGPGKFQDIVQEASNKFGVPTALINAVIRQESAFNPKAISHCGAQGLMQLMPATAKAYGCTDSYDPRQNIMAGTEFLSELLTRYKGNVTLALAGYNAGPGNVAKYGNQVPPFKETQHYVVRVQKFYQDNLAKMEKSGIYADANVNTPARG